MTREFDESELTTKILIAINWAITSLKDDYQVLGKNRITSVDYQKLYDKIKNEKLDIKLVSREY